MNIQEIMNTGEQYSVTNSKGIYDLQSEGIRTNTIASGYLIRKEGHIRGVYYDSKSNSGYGLFIVMPAKDYLLINLLKWVAEDNEKR